MSLRSAASGSGRFGDRRGHALRARRPIWPSPSGPCRPGIEAVSAKPTSFSADSHWARCISGWSGRKSRSVRCHQPCVSPKTDFRPKLRRRHIHEHQGAARGEQLVEHFQRHADIGHGVKHVGADDEIISFPARNPDRPTVFRDRGPCIPPRGRPRVSGSPPEKKPAETSVKV